MATWVTGVGPDQREWLRSLPKVELHIHLEGAIPLPTLFDLVTKYGDPDIRTMAALEARFQYDSFGDFLNTWHWKNQFLRHYEDFTHCAAAAARALAEQNVMRAEAFFSPRDFEHLGLGLPELAMAIRRGLDSVDDVEVALVCDLVRDRGPLIGERTLDQVVEVAADADIIGVGIGGSEEGFPPELFGPVYERAALAGLRRTAHAGEASGAPSVWGALSIGAERIGHGIRAVEDPALVAHLIEHEVALEVCPLSNIATGVVDDVAAHPVRELYDAGVRVTINTDDPGMFGNTLTDDLAVLLDVHGFEPGDIVRVIEHGIDAAWVEPVQRDAMRARLVPFSSGLD